MSATEVEVEGRTLRLTNLDKVLYPACGFTKGEVVDYYARIAPALLPHLRGHPLTLKRYPNGVDAPFFFEKRCPGHRPDWLRTAAGEIPYCVVEDLAGLVWVANLASLELHPGLALAADAGCPTVLVFDLDPGAPADVLSCAEVALSLRDLFDHWGLACFPKTSGSKGMQVYVPLNVETTFEATKTFARAVAETLERRFPDRVTATMSKARRTGRVFVDWSQNDRVKTTISVYALRALERPTVSTPLAWDELEAALAAGDAAALRFDAAEVLARVARDGDLFAPVAELRQELPG
jgi:bifunctional non-homologous end joining protein LigD